MDIRDKHCVITGAGRGLGRQTALELLARGAVVHACDVSSQALDGLRLAAESKNLTCTACDVSEEASVQAFFDSLPAVDVLVNNAGITRDGLLVKSKDGVLSTMPLADFELVLKVNLTGVFLCGRAAAARMVAAGSGGVIINISSVSRHGNFGQTNYSAAKAGVDAMTVTWSKELSRHQIRCAAIAPGYLQTEMTGAIRPDVLEKITAQVPLRRLGQMREIAETVCFIIGNDFVNGKILEIDGGLRL
ncbi:MAG: SDR family oxidoreductase [Lentisphaeria bacterium]|nr:SDR family oxidoreductase [Lentisphaeria bacterium]